MFRVVIVIMSLLAASAVAAHSSTPVAQAAMSPTVFDWGSNASGQLGNGTQTMSPVPVPPGVVATAIAASFADSYAIGADGALYAWGDNSGGELGVGSSTGPQSCPDPNQPTSTYPCAKTPVTVHLPTGVQPTAIAAGGKLALAIGSDGKLYWWGDQFTSNSGSQVIQPTPVAISLPGGVQPVAIATGGTSSLVRGSDGRVYAWGLNDVGQLGVGTTAASMTPVAVHLPAGVTAGAIATDGLTGFAVGSDGNLYAWGLNDFGQLGQGTAIGPQSCVVGSSPSAVTYPCSTTPVTVHLPAGVTPQGVSAAGERALASGSDSKLYSWGMNLGGSLGIGTSTGPQTCYQPSQPGISPTPYPCSPTPLPVQLPAGMTAASFSVGSFNGYAVASGGTLYSWGMNDRGQLGTGSTSGPQTCLDPNGNSFSCSTVPVPIDRPASGVPIAVAGGGSGAMALFAQPFDCSGRVTVALTKIISGPPRQAQITVRAAADGLNAITIPHAQSVTVNVPSFQPGTTDPVVVTATRQDPNVAGSVTVRAVDQAGCSATLDPVMLSVVRAPGQPVVQMIGDITPEEHVVTISNDTPGLSIVILQLNGRTFVLRELKDGEQRLIDIASALRAGSNTMTIIAIGRLGTSASILIGNSD